MCTRTVSSRDLLCKAFVLGECCMSLVMSQIGASYADVRRPLKLLAELLHRTVEVLAWAQDTAHLQSLFTHQMGREEIMLTACESSTQSAVRDMPAGHPCDRAFTG